MKRFEEEHLCPEDQRLADQMNLDESQIPAWTIPGCRSRTAEEFEETERSEILRDFARFMFGEIPPRPQEFSWDLLEEDAASFGGLATRREFLLRCAQNGVVRFLHLLLYLPNLRTGRVPLVFGLNFRGNHSCDLDPDIRFHLPHRYPTSALSPMRISDNRSGEDDRGHSRKLWCFEEVLKRGYATATICLWDMYPDHPQGFEASILRLFFDEGVFRSKERPAGAISAWAWGIERALDVLTAQPEIDNSRIIVHGHSRLGKTALWAGAHDTRIAMVVSNCSGTCGAKLSHRYFGEDFAWVQRWNPHWIVPAFAQFVNHDALIPVDQHQLMGCIAPRLLYVASATEDEYADPKGEFLAARAASEFYRLYGMEGLHGAPDLEFPAPDSLCDGEIAYYLRSGQHTMTLQNWDSLLNYADKHLKSPSGQ